LAYKHWALKANPLGIEAALVGLQALGIEAALVGLQALGIAAALVGLQALGIEALVGHMTTGFKVKH
jgi:hypothetical protein